MGVWIASYERCKSMTRTGFEKDEYFKIDVEAHLSGDKSYISYYPGVQQWWKGVDGTRRAFGAYKKRKVSEIRETEESKAPEEDRLITYMDRYGVRLCNALVDQRLYCGSMREIPGPFYISMQCGANTQEGGEACPLGA
jgi:hypothetical protein